MVRLEMRSVSSVKHSLHDPTRREAAGHIWNPIAANAIPKMTPDQTKRALPPGTTALTTPSVNDDANANGTQAGVRRAAHAVVDSTPHPGGSPYKNRSAPE